jgi:hypothetical protein
MNTEKYTINMQGANELLTALKQSKVEHKKELIKLISDSFTIEFTLPRRKENI